MAMIFSAAYAQGNLKIEASYGSGVNEFSLATGSPGELGLLKVLGEEFGKKENAKMNWVKAGSGASLNLLKTKQVDMIMVHAPVAVNKAIRDNPRNPPSTSQFEFIKGVLELAARKFTKSDEILGKNYDTILTNLYGKLNMQNYPYEKFMDYYFGGVDKFKTNMKNLIDTKLKGLQTPTPTPTP